MSDRPMTYAEEVAAGWHWAQSELGDKPDVTDKLTVAPESSSQPEYDCPAEAPTTSRQVPLLARERDLLSLFVNDLAAAGVAGEERLATLVYLALTSRLLPWGSTTSRPVSVLTKGTTSTGKSYTTSTVLRFFPSDAYFDYSSMSKKFLLYSDESLAHRFLVIDEWTSIARDDELVSSLRTLLSSGRLVHGTVEGEGRKSARKIEKEGPTGLLMGTTAPKTDRELETRCVSVTTDDSPEQTGRIYDVLALLEDEERSPVNFERWHELQRWLAEEGERRVVIPYAKTLAALMPRSSTRLRRDFPSMLCLVRAHAILHQLSRPRDERGRIVATVHDYAVVRELIGDLIAEESDEHVSAAIREAVEAVEQLLRETATEYVSMRPIIDALGIGRTATYDRVRRALMSGYLVNVSAEGERSKKIALGAALPGAAEFLPTVSDLSDAESDNDLAQPGAVAARVSASATSDAPRLRIGEPGYPLQADRAVSAGLITESELRQLLTLNRVLGRTA